MRKPYRKGTVHPTSPLISDQLSFLPATILTLTAALSQEDREVLAYLISCSSTTFSSGNRTTNRATAASTTTTSKYGADHPTCFNCYCFRCYMSYWVRWDSSPNRQLIHEIIDAFEEGLLVQSKKEKTKRERRKIKGSSNGSGELKGSDHKLGSEDRSESVSVEDNSNSSGGGAGSEDGGDELEDFEKGSVRRFVNFLGQKIWSVLA